MRALCVALVVGSLVMLTPMMARGQDYDGCEEQLYDALQDPCGGGHQHQRGKRDETQLEQSRHRHRYLEDQIAQLKKRVDTLQSQVDEMKKGAAK